jgi:3-methyladenine DNA glycosylase/8-oxoguanine DNA glycosylase
VRISRTLNVERFRGLPCEEVERLLLRERGVGPWTIGVVWTEGLGRYDRGIVGDLGLLKLCSAIRGRWVEPEDTAELLEPYEEWAGLACVYLLAGWQKGLVPVQLNSPMIRGARIRARYAA